MTHEVVIVGSGINSLVCAAMLARSGKRVLVLERNDRLGGCIRTEELFPGFTHDVLSGWYPLFLTSPAYAALGPDLHAAGLELLNTTTPTGVIMPEGESLVLTTDDSENIARLNALAPGEGDRYAAAMQGFFARHAGLTFGLLGNEPWSRPAAKLLLGAVRKGGLRETAAFFGEALEPCRAWLHRDFRSPVTRALIAPWVLHAGLGPDDAYSGLMGKVILAALVMAGLPVVQGGSSRIVSAFSRLIEDGGGELVTGAEAEAIVVEGGKAVGVETSDGKVYRAGRAVVCNVTPTQLYGRLLAGQRIPAEITRRASAYRYGRADMQIHFALKERPRWSHPELAEAALLHLTPGLEAVSKAVNEAERGLLPETATVVVGQPAAIDPSRVPGGGWILWVQLQELPSVIGGDGGGQIEVPADGSWSVEVREAYADRIERRLAAHIPNLGAAIVGRRAFSPADLQAINVNLVGGDPYSGSCQVDQFFAWRPFPGVKNHQTPIPNLFHIGASTHPGPGLGGNSGFMVAARLT